MPVEADCNALGKVRNVVLKSRWVCTFWISHHLREVHGSCFLSGSHPNSGRNEGNRLILRGFYLQRQSQGRSQGRVITRSSVRDFEGEG